MSRSVNATHQFIFVQKDKFAGLALAIWLLTALPHASGSPTGHLGACGISFRQFAAGYSKQDSSGELTAEQAIGQDFVMSEHHGLVRVKHLDPATGDLELEFTRKQTISVTRFIATTPATRGRFARLGSQAAGEILEARTLRHFSKPERFPYFFGLKGINAIVGTAAKGAERYEVMNRAWEAVRAETEYADLDLMGMLERWRSLFPSEGHVWPSEADQAKLTAAIDSLIREYHRRTGVNLVKAGIVVESQVFWGHGAAMWRSPFVDQEEHVYSGGTNRSPFLGGTLTQVPMDLALHAMAVSWQKAEAMFPAAGRDLFAFSYLPEREGSDAASSALLAFKKSGDINEVLPYLEPALRTARFQAFREAIPQNSIVMSVPSATGENKSGIAISAWLASNLPGTRLAVDALLTTSVRPQKLQSSTLERLANMAGADVQIKTNVKGKVVVLVDDVITTGATTEKMKQELLKAGAAAVHVFSLAKTRAVPDLASTDGLTNLPSAALPPKSVVVPVANRDFIATLTFPFPWANKKVKDLEPLEKQTRDRFEKAVRESDIATLFPLTDLQLDSFDSKGRPAKGPKTLRTAFLSDDVTLVQLVKKLNEASTGEDYAAIKNSPLGRAVLERAKQKADHGPFANQAGPWLLEWLGTQ